MSDIEAFLDFYAANLAARLNKIADLEGEGQGKAPSPSKVPICTVSSLDWLSHANGDPISRRQKNHSEFSEQIRLCGMCGHQNKCLETATDTNAEYGIWGGLLPRERMT